MMFGKLGKSLGILALLISVSAIAALTGKQSEAQLQYMKAELWSGETGGNAKVAPKISLVDSPVGKAIRVSVETPGEYQGMSLQLPEKVDLRKVGSITFDIEQNAYKKNGQAAVMLMFPNGSGLIATPEFNASGWRHVTIPIDVRTLRSLGSQSSPALGEISEIKFSVYAALKSPGQHLSIANLEFHPPVLGEGLLTVVSYRYNARPTAGDHSCTWLTDNKVERDRQAFFREYSDEPDITFDLGALYLIRKFKLSAIAIPSQNASEALLYTSYDGQQWKLAKHIPNRDAGTEEKSYDISEEEMNLLARYVRVHLGRNRTDFPVRIGEISFEGKLPTEEEMVVVASQQYDLGPNMPEVNEKDYWKFADPEGAIWIDRKNGILVHYERNDHLLAERIFSKYELTDGKTSLKADAYDDQVISGEMDGQGAFAVTTENPAIPGVIFVHRYYWRAGDLTMELSFISSRKDRKILFTATEVVLPQKLRKGGLYETWGAGHDLQHKFANEVTFDFPADTGPVTIFEAPQAPLTLLHYRYKYNDRYVQIGSGVVTVSGFGDKRTIFTATGWILGDGLFALTSEGASGKIESRLSIVPGDLTAAFDHYLALPEVNKFRAAIKRAAWLKDLRFYSSGPGWDGRFGDNMQRAAENAGAMIREGWVNLHTHIAEFPWGDFPTSGELDFMRGGKIQMNDLCEKLRQIKKYPVKISQYTWLWSAAWNSKIYQEHPDWFIRYNAQGKETSFFPGYSQNFYRLVGLPESRAEIVRSINAVMDAYLSDLWYLDGGGSPSSIDWATMRIDEPDAWDNTLLEVRRTIQQKDPERAVFFNNPENPIGDMGYLESFGGILTTNWRDGATWMYKFKLWQRPDPLFSPLYIYWLSGVDQAMRHYIVGTGLGMTTYSTDLRPDVSYMSAQQQSRWAKLVDGAVAPNWRYSSDEMLEVMPLTLGNAAWLFMKAHSETSLEKTVSADPSKLGMTDSTKPLYHWCMTVKPHSLHRGLLSETEREADYRASRWQNDFVVIPKYLGAERMAPRMSRKFSFAPDELKLWLVTQSPALVYSVDGMRNQLWLPDTLGVKVEGLINAQKIDLLVQSERKEAEIVSVLPAGFLPVSVRVNGVSATFSDCIVLDDTPLALVSVPQGKSKVEILLKAVEPLSDDIALQVTPGQPGKELTLKITAPAAAKVLAAITSNLDLVWSGVIQAGKTSIKIPTGVTGGDYQATLYDGTGKILTTRDFKLASGKPKHALFRRALPLKQENSSEDLDIAFTNRGFKLLRMAETHSLGAGNLRFEPNEAKLTLTIDKAPESRWYLVGGAYEFEAKRFVKLKLSGSFGQYNREAMIAGVKGLGTNYDMPNCYLGLTFDFGANTEAGNAYVSRSMGGIGLAWPNRTSPEPLAWGTKQLGDIINIVSSFAVNKKDEEEFWLDLDAVGSPDNWNGRLWLGALYQDGAPNRVLELKILET
ncbi:MAG: discoidin domain-containing protein, partial [Lentisphaeria bacterium]